MLESIFEAYKMCTYDFRVYANLQDPLIEHFEEWVNYYRLKWAIARVLNPSRILEIGVRYGYSAHAFLDAVPDACYIGLDADLPTFGGQPGAIDWAKKSLHNFKVSILRENTQHLTRLPDGVYDLVHIDGQQDGDGTFHDLNLAIQQSHYILIDGYNWSRENFLATNEWIWLNRAAIKTASIIPGYAGELLIQTKLDKIYNTNLNVDSSLQLTQTYTSEYYLNDCGGYSQWSRNKNQITDSRLRAVADLGMAFGIPTKLVDLGFGRGELTKHFAAQGTQVTAIDYSPSAIKLIEKTIGDDVSLNKNISIICDSVLNRDKYDGDYEIAIASDIIEHLSPDEDELLYQIISERLRVKDGVFIIHTSPNIWFYKYEHPRQQQAARNLGFWLPRTRRTWYERIMHINEQSPRVLKKQLSRYFSHVCLWFGSYDDPGGSLLRHYRISNIRQSSSIFAVASNHAIDIKAIKAALAMEPLPMDEADKIKLHVIDAPNLMEVGKKYTVKISLVNGSNRLLASRHPNPIHLSYHWKDAVTGDIAVFEGLRSLLLPPCPSGRFQEYKLKVDPPKNPGFYFLKITLVQEMVKWYEDACKDNLSVEIIKSTIPHSCSK